jgi:hypothetical protein
MGSSFLIPSLWEYYVFVDKDPRIAEMIVMYGDALMKHGVVKPDVWTKGQRSARTWMMAENPTPWISLYFGNPYDLSQAIVDQDADGWYSDLHNPEAIFALSAAYFFSCNESFKLRVDEMWGFFSQENARENSSPLRIFLWQHRGSASTEWLLENAACTASSPNIKSDTCTNATSSNCKAFSHPTSNIATHGCKATPVLPASRLRSRLVQQPHHLTRTKVSPRCEQTFQKPIRWMGSMFPCRPSQAIAGYSSNNNTRHGSRRALQPTSTTVDSEAAIQLNAGGTIP